MRVLIIEDETAISNFIATTLKSNGYMVLLSSSGKEALSMIASHCPDVILLDLTRAETMITGILDHFLNCFNISKPSMSGNPKSNNITSGQ